MDVEKSKAKIKPVIEHILEQCEKQGFTNNEMLLFEFELKNAIEKCQKKSVFTYSIKSAK